MDGSNQLVLATGLQSISGVAIDYAGNLFLSDYGARSAYIVQRSTPPTLAFADTSVSNTSSDSPKPITLENIGNVPLGLIANRPSSGQSDFQQVSGSGTSVDCSNLSPSSLIDSCSLSYTFSPASAGPIQTTVRILSNSLYLSGGYINESANILLQGNGNASIQPGPGSPSPFLIGQTGGPVRNNYTGFVGMQFTTGSTPVSVSSLGRIVAPGNSGTHTVKLVFTNGADVLGGSAPVSLAVIPAIPATKLSGHVYDEFRKPISGCEISVLLENPEEPTQLYELDIHETDQGGSFAFAGLGSGRFFVRARCRRYLPGERKGYGGVVIGTWKVRNSWPTTLFPNALALAQAKAIVLLPGNQRSDIDFHLLSLPQYSLRGRVVSGKQWSPDTRRLSLKQPYGISSGPDWRKVHAG